MSIGTFFLYLLPVIAGWCSASQSSGSSCKSRPVVGLFSFMVFIQMLACGAYAAFTTGFDQLHIQSTVVNSLLIMASVPIGLYILDIVISNGYYLFKYGLADFISGSQEALFDLGKDLELNSCKGAQLFAFRSNHGAKQTVIFCALFMALVGYFIGHAEFLTQPYWSMFTAPALLWCKLLLALFAAQWLRLLFNKLSNSAERNAERVAFKIENDEIVNENKLAAIDVAKFYQAIRSSKTVAEDNDFIVIDAPKAIRERVKQVATNNIQKDTVTKSIYPLLANLVLVLRLLEKYQEVAVIKSYEHNLESAVPEIKVDADPYLIDFLDDLCEISKWHQKKVKGALFPKEEK